MMAHQRELDRRQFESLCGMQRSVEELCGWFGCDKAALNTWCVDTYGEDFRSAFDRLAMMGRIALRATRSPQQRKTCPWRGTWRRSGQAMTHPRRSGRTTG